MTIKRVLYRMLNSGAAETSAVIANRSRVQVKDVESFLDHLQEKGIVVRCDTDKAYRGRPVVTYALVSKDAAYDFLDAMP